MQLHNLQRRTTVRSAKRIGRGGKRGKTSGRGMKGQKARAGHRIRPEVRDIIKRLPKQRGYGKNRPRTVNNAVVKPNIVNLSLLEAHFNSGEGVTPRILKDRGLLRGHRGRKTTSVKILGSGTLSKKLSISGCAISKKAREQVERRGGQVISTGT